MTLVRTAAALMAATFALGALAAGNTTNEDFRDAKKMLERKVYFDHRVTLYCGYAFDKQKNVSLPAGFVAPQHKERAGRVEGEHVFTTRCPITFAGEDFGPSKSAPRLGEDTRRIIEEFHLDQEEGE